MLSRLDMETREHHDEVDAHWLDLLMPGVTREQYQQLLARVYGFEAPFEGALARTPQLVVADRLELARSGYLAQDLLALGVSAHAIACLPQCPSISMFGGPAEALGWKYAVERPAKLHGAIKRNVLARLDDVADACSYFFPCDGTASARWERFGLLVEIVAQRPGAAELMLAAARDAFVAMNEWFRQEQDTAPLLARTQTERQHDRTRG